MSKITKVCSKLELKWDPQGQVLKSESSQKERPNDMTAGMQRFVSLLFEDLPLYFNIPGIS